MKIRSLFILGMLTFASSKVLGSWDLTTPAGTEAKSMGDDRIREFKTDVQTTLQYEGDFPGSDTSNPRFIYTPSTGTTLLRPTGNARATGMLYINISSGCVEQYDGTNWGCVGVLTSSVVVPSNLNVSVAGNGLSGGGGIPLNVNVDTNSFVITNDTITIKAGGITSTMLNSSITVNDLQTVNLRVATATWQGFGILPILQIQSFTTNTSSSTTSVSFVPSNVTVTITPKLATSKIFVWATGNANNGADEAYYTISRNGTNLASTTGLAGILANVDEELSLMAYDSPSTTSAVAYTVYMRNKTGGIVASYPTTHFTAVPTCTIIAAEIAQ